VILLLPFIWIGLQDVQDQRRLAGAACIVDGDSSKRLSRTSAGRVIYQVGEGPGSSCELVVTTMHWEVSENSELGGIAVEIQEWTEERARAVTTWSKVLSRPEGGGRWVARIPATADISNYRVRFRGAGGVVFDETPLNGIAQLGQSADGEWRYYHDGSGQLAGSAVVSLELDVHTYGHISGAQWAVAGAEYGQTTAYTPNTRWPHVEWNWPIALTWDSAMLVWTNQGWLGQTYAVYLRILPAMLVLSLLGVAVFVWAEEQE